MRLAVWSPLPPSTSGIADYVAESLPTLSRHFDVVTVTDDGPYAVTGGIELVGVAFGEGASHEHYTLCRCGASKNKPFCDGSHWQVGFRDASG